METQVDVSIIEARIEHRDFPFPLAFSGGRVITRPEGVLLENLRTTPGFAPSIRFQGKVERRAGRDESSGATVLEYRAAIEDLRLDDRFVAAASGGLATLFEATRLRGLVAGRVDGKSVFQSGAPDEHTFQASGLRLRDLALDFGLKIKDIFAFADLSGSFRSGQKPLLDGEFFVERATFNRLGLRDLNLYLTQGSRHPLVSGQKKPGKHLPSPAYALPSGVRKRLDGRDPSDLLAISVTCSNFYRGKLEGFLYAECKDEGEYGAHFLSDRIDMHYAVKDIFGEDIDSAAGEAGGNVELSGRLGGGSLVGKGLGTIRNGQLAQVPLFHELLSLLKLNEEAVFKEVRLPFEIRDQKFHSKNIVVSSGVLSLNGGGTLDFDGKLDLLLQPVFVPVDIPLLSILVENLKKVIAQVQVAGTLQKPRVSFRSAGVVIPIDTSGDSRK